MGEVDHSISLSCVRTLSSSPKGGTFTLLPDETFHLLFLLRQSFMRWFQKLRQETFLLLNLSPQTLEITRMT